MPCEAAHKLTELVAEAFLARSPAAASCVVLQGPSQRGLPASQEGQQHLSWLFRRSLLLAWSADLRDGRAHRSVQVGPALRQRLNDAEGRVPVAAQAAAHPGGQSLVEQRRPIRAVAVAVRTIGNEELHEAKLAALHCQAEST
eukprot:CAMPEP_0171139250 /NCGR_PEP_ID=MMETSP0766_2-20121228/136541_1 /TAXON_ID=439317 /ORGANISM="Gambierdiscus australes, Strain CAWD 149" /LENGTH=142 /DNA_ID=CAMNT_0011602903 /DNA_START=242 /DNA_END=667 /DNA_ORIENTATION=+